MDNTRELVLDLLMEILEKKVYSHLVLREVLDKYDYSDSRDKAFVKRVTQGTLERLIQIDYCLDQFSKVPVRSMKPLIRNLMRMSAYQILFMDKVPDSAACNEAVKLAGKRGFRGLSGFVNGVLRNLSRNKKKISYPAREKDPVYYLSVTCSMPEHLVKLWCEAYGEEKTGIILEGILQEQPLSVRLSQKLSGEKKEKWLLALEKAGIKAEQHPYLPYAFRLRNTEGVRSLPGYEEGFFTVQDVSSMLVSEVAYCMLMEGKKEKDIVGKPDGCERKPDDFRELLAVDVCASPGGKSMHMAEKLSGTGKVISRDVSEYKVSLIRDNIERMGYTNIEPQLFDAAITDTELLEKADVVLADLPCSGLGVTGKKRDITYRITGKELSELVQLQKRILGTVWQYVKNGGILIYSTCTMNPEENGEMIKWFTQNHPFVLEDISPCLPGALKQEGKEGMLQLFPGIHKTDGFFLAGMRRIG